MKEEISIWLMEAANDLADGKMHPHTYYIERAMWVDAMSCRSCKYSWIHCGGAMECISTKSATTYGQLVEPDFYCKFYEQSN